MDNIFLTKLMKNDPKVRPHFKGCFPRDWLPAKLEQKSLYVVNLSKAGTRGTHWVLLSVMSDEYSAYICSMGSPPTHQNIIDSLYSVSSTVVYSDFRNQQLMSSVCGFHCVFVAAMLSRGHRLLDIMTRMYENSQYINDNSVCEIIQSAHDIKETIPIFDWDFILTGRGVSSLKSTLSPSDKKRMDGIGIVGSSREDAQFPSMAAEKSKASRKRKQENPKKKTPEGRTKKKIKANEKKKENSVWKREKKDQRGSKTIKNAGKKRTKETFGSNNAQNSSSALSGKADLVNEMKSYGKTSEEFQRMLINFEKRLNFINDPDTLKVVKFLLYLVVKERRSRYCDQLRFAHHLDECNSSRSFPC